MGQEEGTQGWATFLWALAMSLAGFVAAAAVIHLCVGSQLRLHADVRSEKLTLMDQWQGKAYSAAFGSSHIHNGFDPRSFDVATAGTPLQTRSLNLAIAGGSQTEQRATALAFLQNLQAPPRVGANVESRACVMFLELNAGANFTNDHLIHPRAINIYDANAVRFVWRLTSPSMGLKQRLGRVGYSIAAMALHYMNVGMLSSMVFAPPIDREMLATETVDDRRGLLAIKVTPKMYANIEREVAEAPRQSKARPQEPLPGNSDLLNELTRRSPVSNLNLVYVVAPMLADLTSYPLTPDTLPYSGGAAPVMNMARPDLYPELYQAKYWTDDAHLNESGARLMTKLMAERLKAWYAAHGEPARCGG